LNTQDERWLEGGSLAVRFFWHHDRFAHEVAVREGDGWRAMGSSVEGSPDDEWPASPPFQSLHVEHRDDGRQVALLVGMAGKSHWSASIEIDAAVPCISFDVACRIRTIEPGPLGSTYQSSEDDHPLHIELTGRFGPAQLERHASQTRVAADATGDACPRTVRWDYRIVAS